MGTIKKLWSWFVMSAILLTPSLGAATGSGYSPVTYDGSIKFSATLQADGTVKTEWSPYSHTEPFSYYKVVRSPDNDNPVYPDDGYIFFTTDTQVLTYTDHDVPEGTSYYRVCQIAAPARYCSQEVVKINKTGSTDTQSGTLTANAVVSDQRVLMYWDYNGTASQGFKVVWGPTSGPTYPGRTGDSYHYLSDPASTQDTISDLASGVYFFRVCVYNGSSCTTYSNELRVVIGNTICVDKNWSPDTATVCAGQTFWQNSQCGTRREARGTKICTGTPPPATTLDNCPVFPANNPWNQDISTLPVHPNSENYLRSIGLDGHLHADFGGNGQYGIPYTVVHNSTPKLNINFTAYGEESDAGPYPIPLTAPIEGGSNSDGDRHVLAVDTDNCKLYEMYRAFPRNGGWEADSGAIFDLRSNALRPAGWTSADAAGLPILAGLARYDEVASGQMNHALRFTVGHTQRKYIYPARHYASDSIDQNLPPMGLRLRLKADFDTSRYYGQSKVILETLKKYGMMVADNGADWFISGATDTRWVDADLDQLKGIPGSAFEVVNTELDPEVVSSTKTAATTTTNVTSTTGTTASATFNDITRHWARQYIEQLAQRGVISGDGQNFYPDELITRAEFVKIIIRTLNYSSPNEITLPFTDTPAEAWSTPYIRLAYGAGWINGYPDNTFRPNRYLTRAEAAAILVKALQINYDSSMTTNFVDIVYHWANHAISALKWHNLINGYDATHFAPENRLTRAEAAKLVQKGYEWFNN